MKAGSLKYRKKPVVIEAVLWDGTESGYWHLCGELGANERNLWPGESIGRAGMVRLNIRTPDSIAHAYPGDWVIKGVKGEFYPCKPDIFAATYEQVEP